MSWEFELVAGPFDFTEGPIWDGENVYFSDIPNDRILKYNPETGECETAITNTNAANGLKLGPDGDIYACEMNGRCISKYDPDGERTVIVSEADKGTLNSPNDLWFDTEDRLWFTDPHYATDWLSDEPRDLGHESVYMLPLDEQDPELRRMTFDTTRPNGLLVSPNNETLFVAQSKYDESYCDGGRRELRAYSINDEELGEYEVLHNFYPHRAIDGMCFDVGGNIVACAGWADSGPGPMIYVFQDDGRVLETHPFPGGNPTNCAFGGDDMTTLYVASADGGLYRAETDHRGYLTPDAEFEV